MERVWGERRGKRGGRQDMKLIGSLSHSNAFRSRVQGVAFHHYPAASMSSDHVSVLEALCECNVALDCFGDCKG